MPNFPYKRGPFTVLSSSEKYRNKWINVREDQVLRPDGKPGIFGVVEMLPGVAVVALDTDEQIHLVETFCYALNKYFLEVPGGGLDGDEEPMIAAQRELKEEIGCEAKQWRDLNRMDPFTGIVHSPAYLYLAQDLSFTAPDHSDGEPIRAVKIPFAEAIQKVMDGEIVCGPSCCAILKAARILGR